MSTLHPTVWALAWVSFCNDAASELVTPLIPFLLADLGAGAIALGAIEGVANALAALLKVYSGARSDGGRRKPWVLGGYLLSNLARPLIGLATSSWWVGLMRATDRIGKGLRTAPRDALIRDLTPSDRLGRAFGLQRALDNGGAVVGGLLAAAALAAGVGTRNIIITSGVIGAIVLTLLVVVVKDGSDGTGREPTNGQTGPFGLRYGSLPVRLKLFIVASGIAALGRIPETFLILWSTAAGYSVLQSVLLWVAFSAAKSAGSWFGGGWVDRIGAVRSVVWGWGAIAITVGGLAAVIAAAPGTGGWLPVAIAMLYGAVFGAFEGAELAAAAELAPDGARGAGLGWFHLVRGAAAIPGGIALGVLVAAVSLPLAFAVAAVSTVAAAGLAAWAVAVRGR